MSVLDQSSMAAHASAIKYLNKRLKELDEDFENSGFDDISILRQQIDAMQSEIIRLRERERDVKSLLEQFGFSGYQDNAKTCEIATRNSELISKGKHMEKLETFNKENPTLNDLWTKYMLMLRLSGGDQQ